MKTWLSFHITIEEPMYSISHLQEFITKNIIDARNNINSRKIFLLKDEPEMVHISSLFGDYTMIDKLRLIRLGKDMFSCETCGSIITKERLAANFDFTNFVCGDCRKQQISDKRGPRKHPIKVPKPKKPKVVKVDDGLTTYQRLQKAMMEKYGVDHPSKLKSIRDKRKQTMLDKYGVTHNFQMDEVKKKIKQTNIEKYGVDHALKKPEILEKQYKTNIERYGVKNVSKNEIIRQKQKDTMMKRYGVEYPMESQENLNKAIETNRKKLGVDFPTQSPLVIEKTKQTNIRKFGETSAAKNPEIKEKMIEGLKKHHRNKLPENYIEILKEKYSEYCENKLSLAWLSESTRININLLKSLMEENDLEIKNHPIRVSGQEYALFKTVESFYEGEIIQSDRKQLEGKEIDIWIPEKNLGIEFHGVYWHSGKTMDHLEKFQIAKKNGITLLQIFSSEWEQKPETVISIIKSKMGMFDKRIYARQTTVREVSHNDYMVFTDTYHLQGSSIAKVRLGLYHGDELVSIMSFSKSRFSKKHEWEMIRYCNKFGHQIIGGASKLFAYFVKNYNPSSIVTYADARHSFGTIYTTLGFDFVNHSSPNYFYFNNTGILESRQKYQKHKLEKLFPDIYDVSKTERQIMNEAGYGNVYDAGNLVFEWIKEE